MSKSADAPDVQSSLLSEPSEPAVRYHLFDKRIGVTSRALALRLWISAVGWIGAVPQVARVLGRLGAWRAQAYVQRWWARGLTSTLQIDLDIAGLEHIDRRETYIVTPLHEGFADALALLQLPLQLRFVVRDELADWRHLGPYLRDTEQIIINPENGRQAYRQLRAASARWIAQGESVVIFPQGSILGIEIDFQRGAFALARALRCPILPVVLTGGHRVWEHPYTPRLRYGQRMSMRVLPPISVHDLLAGTSEEVRYTVQQQLKDAALDGMLAPPRRFVPIRDGYWDGYAYTIDPRFAELAADIARHRESTSL